MSAANRQEGIVIEVSGRMAKVKASRHNDCANCGACPGNSATVLDARNPVGARTGQKVVVEIQEINMLKAAFTVYILPLIVALLGVLLGGEFAAWLGASETLGRIIGGGGAFLAAVCYVRYYDQSVRTDVKMQPVIVSVLS
jgi:Positive regulator of sigma E activity